ncbi:hypothetical protein RB653_006275 [Dictyostelium firmibasis]|uniref:Uncharacterized protein n=1 Tax=Dictyostelium firmibasis TaxID=79012 RepID=A0AAN7YTL6_9MYCE
MVKLFGKSKKKEETPQSIDIAFQSILDEIGVVETEKKHLMATMDTVRKQQLIQSYSSKKFSKNDFGNKSKKKSVATQSPHYFVDCLKNDPSKEVLTSLRVRLGNQPLKWLKEFLSLEGVPLLIKVLISNEIKQVKNQEDIYKIAQCLHSLKLIMNTKFGLESVIKQPTNIHSISLVMDTPHLKTRIMVIELLAALCVVNSKGLPLVLNAMDNYREVKREKKPFIHLFQGLKNPSGSLQATTFALINTLISSSPSVEERQKIRNQFKKLGIAKVIEELESEYENNPDLATQKDLYEQECRWDEQEQIENARGDITDENPEALVKAILDRTAGGPLYSSFTSILRLLANSIADHTKDQSLSNYLFVEKIIGKMNNGESFLDDIGSFFGGGSGEGGLEIAHVSGEKAVLIQKEIEDLKKQRKRDQDKLAEKDILLTKLAKRMRKMEEAIKLGKGLEYLNNQIEIESPPDSSTNTPQETTPGGTKVPLKTSPVTKADLKHKLSTFTTAKAPNGVSDFLSGLDAVGAKQGTDSDTTTDVDASGSGVPLPPGAPPPPPPPGKLAPSTPQLCSRPPSVKMKTYQWTRYRTRNVTNTFWKNVNLTKYNDCLPHEQIEGLFGAAIFEKKEKELKKGSEITVIDSKRAQNIGILLSRFKNVTHDSIYDAIYNLDESILDLETINQFIKYIPSKEEIDCIIAFKKQQEQVPEEERMRLGKSEIFIDKISSIPRLEQRIQALHFKLNFPDKLYHAKPDIRKFNEAFVQLQNNNMFAIMELILSIGNFINFGTNRGNASGFKVDSINKMADTKSNVREKYTLVHYLIELLESTQPELLKVFDEIPSVVDAATLSFNQSSSEIKLLRSGLIRLEKEIFVKQQKPVEPKSEEDQGNSENVEEEDKDVEKAKEEEEEEVESTGNSFADSLKKKKTQVGTNSASNEDSKQLEPLKDDDPLKLKLSEFLLASKTELDDTEALLAETETLFKSICKFFGEDSTKTQPEEFLAIFKKFNDKVVMSKKDLEIERSIKDKATQRKNEKERKEIEIKKSKMEKIHSKLKKIGSPSSATRMGSNESSPTSSTSSVIHQHDEDEETIREYINNPSPSQQSNSSEEEGMMDDVLNLIRDGNFRELRRMNLQRKPVRTKRVIAKQPTRPQALDTPSSTYSSISSMYDAEPLDMSDQEDEEDDEEGNENSEDDDDEEEYEEEEEEDEEDENEEGENKE